MIFTSVVITNSQQEQADVVCCLQGIQKKEKKQTEIIPNMHFQKHHQTLVQTAG